MAKVTPEEAFNLLADKDTTESILENYGQVGLRKTKEYFLGSIEGQNLTNEQGVVDTDNEKIQEAFTYAVANGPSY